MRERITYIQKLGDSLEPSSVRVDDGAISGPEVHAVREDRLTFALSELPTELQTLLAGIQDLHIRWVSTTASEAVSPLLARLPPGFHVFFTPGKDGDVLNELCPLLTDIFGDISCSSPDESFTSLPKDRFPHSATFQYFQQLGSLSKFIQFAKDRLCRPADTSCSSRLDSLSKASSLDISYDTTQPALKVTAHWPYQRQPLHAAAHSQHRTEVGILSTDKPETLEAHEIGMSGLLTVLGQDANPSPTMFSFASRHRDAESSFSAQFLPPTGLHPTLQLRLASGTSLSPEDDTCIPYAYLTLPRAIFADKYQLSDPLFLASQNLTALRHTTQPVDLEAPAYVMPQWGSSVLLQLSTPSPPPPPAGDEKGGKTEGKEWTASIPLHLRYLPPAAGGYTTLTVPYPAVFWACEPEPEQAVAFPNSPFEKGTVGYDGLFEEGTVFWHVEPKPVGGDGSLVNVVRVPVLDLDRAGWVNAGTAVAVVVGFVWVVWKLIGVYAARGEGGAVRVGEGEREKKRQ